MVFSEVGIRLCCGAVDKARVREQPYLLAPRRQQQLFLGVVSRAVHGEGHVGIWFFGNSTCNIGVYAGLDDVYTVEYSLGGPCQRWAAASPMWPHRAVSSMNPRFFFI